MTTMITGNGAFLIREEQICPCCQGKGTKNYDGWDVRCVICDGHGYRIFLYSAVAA